MADAATTAIIAGDLENWQAASTDFAMLRMLARALPDAPILDFPTQEGSEPSLAASVLRGEGFIVETVPPPRVRPNNSPHGIAASVAFCVYEGLKNRRFDTLHFTGDVASGHYLSQARHLGMIANAPTLVVHMPAPLLYRYEIGRDRATNYADLARLFMERRVAELSDTVVVHDTKTADWMRKRGWKVDPAVAPGLNHLPCLPRRRPDQPEQLRRLLFAGSQTDVKGWTTFTYAVQRLESKGAVVDEIVISGAIDSVFPGDQFLDKMDAMLNAPIRMLRTDERAAFLQLARSPGSLTLVPPRFDERSAVLEELIAIDAPVIASDVGDVRLHLHPDDAKAILVPPHHHDLCARIEERIAAGLVTDYKSLRKAELDSNSANWVALAHRPTDSRKATSAPTSKSSPLVSICVAHFNRLDSIMMTLESIYCQTYENTEIIIVDDGSDHDKWQKLKEHVSDRPRTKLIRQENRYLGAVRNTGARNATGEYLLFKDDDNIAKPGEVAAFVEIAERNQSDILTCFSDNFEGDGVPDAKSITGIRRMPFGPDPCYGMFRNGFGDSNCFVRRRVWEEMGGFTEHYKIGLDDHEFFLRATVSGFTVEVVPEALYYYRLGGEKMKQFHITDLANEQRIMTPLIESGYLPAEWLPVIMLARGNKDRTAAPGIPALPTNPKSKG